MGEIREDLIPPLLRNEKVYVYGETHIPTSDRDENQQEQTSWSRMTKKWWVIEHSHDNKARKKEIVTEWYEVSDTCVHEKPESWDYFLVFSELKTTL